MGVPQLNSLILAGAAVFTFAYTCLYVWHHPSLQNNYAIVDLWPPTIACRWATLLQQLKTPAPVDGRH
jgi:hypothetical protein